VDAGKQGGNWIEDLIAKHRDEIDDNDLADFRRLYAKVDIGYIRRLSKEGFTDEEEAELKTYLRGQYGGEYERAKDLYFEYAYILNEEDI
jgi:hypothetical protein